ncbi:MAG: alanyl-tRNA editing protein, partial [Pseudomonadota bacterium]
MTIETTDPLYLTDPYVRETSATVSHVNDRGGILVDIPLFYATSGGQPGDSGTLTRQDGSSVMIATTVYDDERRAVLVPDGGTSPEIGERVTLALDWDKRYRHMRMHTALHLLSAALPYPVTGGAIGVTESRLDF